MFNPPLDHATFTIDQFELGQPQEIADVIDTFGRTLITALSMPLTFSIATGIGLGFISYVTIKLVCGRIADISAAMWLIAAIFVLYFATV